MENYNPIHPVIRAISDELYDRDALIKSLEKEIEDLKARMHQMVQEDTQRNKENIGQLFSLVLSGKVH